MSNLDRALVIVICCPLVGGAVLSSGCEDSATARRTEVQANLATVRHDLWASTAIASDPTPQERTAAEAKLKTLLTMLADTDGAAPGQQAAASLLASNVHRKIAAITLAGVGRLETEQRRRRDVLGGMIDAAAELHALAGSLETIDTQAQHQHLAANRQNAQARLASYGEAMAAADAPIAALTNANRDDQTEIDNLRAQANQLMRDASEQGPAAGYGAYEQSVQLDRDADHIQYDVSQRDLELEFTLQPARALAQTRAGYTQSLIGAIDESRAAIDGLLQTFDDEARTTRKTIAQLRDEIVAELGELNQARTNELTDAYERAAKQLSAAADKAENAARLGQGESVPAARIEAVRANLELGHMHWSAAQAWQDHGALLDRVQASSGALGSASMVSAQVTAARTAHADALDNAKNAYTNAQSQLSRVTGRSAGPQLEALKQDVQTAISALSGETVDLTPAPTPRAPRSRRPSSLGAGADSPEALLAAINQADSLASMTNLFVELTYVKFRNAAERELYSIMITSARASLKLEQALQERFDTGLMELGQAAWGGGADMFGGQAGFGFGEAQVQDARLGDVAGDNGTIIVTSAGQTDRMPIIRVNGRWYVDGTTASGDGLAMGIGGEGAQMFKTIMQDSISSLNDLTNRIRAGEFTSIEQVQEALTGFTQQMQQKFIDQGAD